jgi:HemY protein
MKSLLITLVALALAVVFALLVMKDPGYVLITLKPWSIELSLTFFLVLLAAVFVLLYLAIRFLVRTWNTPKDVKRWRKQRLTTKAHKLQTRGMMRVIEGDWKKAEQQLMSHLANSETPALNYLGAAHAAQGRGNLEQRDRYLALAHKADPSQVVAIGLTQATLQYRSGQTEQALATLKSMRGRAPKNPKVLGLSVKVMAELQDWKGLLDTLPAARKYGGVPAEDAVRLQSRANQQLLAHSPEDGQLESAWQSLARDDRRDPELLKAYAERQIELGNVQHAEELLRKEISRNWQPALVRLYGRVKGNDPARQLKAAEKWAANHEDSPELMLTLAQLSLNNELWGKARAYLEACIASGGSAEAYRELGQLLEQLDERDAALELYRDVMERAVPSDQRPVALPAAEPVPTATGDKPPD